MTREGSGRRYVLVDDDATYLSIMQRIAAQEGMDLDVYTSLINLGSIGLLGRYDAAIVDYDLGSMTGIEVAQYLNTFFGRIPMVLVSGQDRVIEQKWPENIKFFAKKSEGYASILKTLEKCVEEAQKKQNQVGLKTGGNTYAK
jgi:CheY-like chemotaxis protein